MKHTVVGLFDFHADAERAAEALVRNGFDRSALHITDEKTHEMLAPSAVIEGGTGIAGLRISELFANLFGPDDKSHAAQYEEAVRRGGTVLHVEVADESRVAAATGALKAAGAINIEDRVGEWTRSGWDSGGTAGVDEPVDTQTQVDPVAARAAATSSTGVRNEVVSNGGVRVYSSTAVRGYDDYANDFRADHASRYASQGGAYDEYEPAYRHGHSLASDARYRGRSWSEIASDVERDWKAKYPSSPWQQFKDAVRHAWERVSS